MDLEEDLGAATEAAPGPTEKCHFDELPDEILEFVLGLLPPYEILKLCMRVCKRWETCCQNVMRKVEASLYRAVAATRVEWETLATPTGDAGAAAPPPSITKRYSHAACVHDGSMYVFGGCTANATAFNDLWRFDLSRRRWARPPATGSYPTPKAHATLVARGRTLVLFGGRSERRELAYGGGGGGESAEVHLYDTRADSWTRAPRDHDAPPPPPLAGHSALLRADGRTMVVFGGLYDAPPDVVMRGSNDVWRLDLVTMRWTKVRIATMSPKPSPRHGHSMIALDDGRAMILGGMAGGGGGGGGATRACDDCWILEMRGGDDAWAWREVAVEHRERAVGVVWCGPACRVGDKVVTLSHERNGYTGATYPINGRRLYAREREPENQVALRLERNMRRAVDNDDNVNGRRGVLPNARQNLPRASTNRDEGLPGPSRGAAGSTDRSAANDESAPSSSNPNANQNSNVKNKNANGIKIVPITAKIIRHVRDNFRMAAFTIGVAQNAYPNNQLFHQRRLDRLNERRDLHDRQRQQEQQPPPPEQQQRPIANPAIAPAVKKMRRNTLALRILDISSLIDANSSSSPPRVSWMEPRESSDAAPEEVILYSLVRGTGELIMFGGLQCDTYEHRNCTVSNQFSNSLHFIKPPKNVV